MPISVVAHVHIALVFFHVLSIAVGFGAALLADWIVLTKMTFTPVPARAVEAVESLSKAVSLGLIGLWGTGIALFVFNWQQHPAALLNNEKIWAKIVIVCVLTINAVALHRLVLPTLARRVGLPLFGACWFEPLLPTLIGAVSASSWLFATYLGVGRELNGVARLGFILALYAAGLAVSWAISLSLALLGCAKQTAAPMRSAHQAPLQHSKINGCQTAERCLSPHSIHLSHVPSCPRTYSGGIFVAAHGSWDRTR